jgi:hypothetical protein
LKGSCVTAGDDIDPSTWGEEKEGSCTAKQSKNRYCKNVADYSPVVGIIDIKALSYKLKY